MNSNETITTFVVEYEFNGRCYKTFIEAYTREHALDKFAEEYPWLEMRECYEADEP